MFGRHAYTCVVRGLREPMSCVYIEWAFSDLQVKIELPVPARKCLTLEHKVQLIREVEKRGRQKSEIARQFGIPLSELSTVQKNKDALLDGFKKSFSAKRKRNRNSTYPEVKRALLK